MANHKSALKRARQNTNRRMRNKAAKTKVKHVVKEVRSAIRESSKDDALKELNLAKSVIDKTARKGIIHRNTAAINIWYMSSSFPYFIPYLIGFCCN